MKEKVIFASITQDEIQNLLEDLCTQFIENNPDKYKTREEDID